MSVLGDNSLKNPLKLITAGLIMCASFLAQAQSMSLDDLLSGNKYPSTLKLSDLTPQYRVLRLSVSGSGGGLGDLMGAFSPLMMRGGMNAQPGSDLLTLLGTYWTTGQTTSLAGHDFLVTYKLEMGIKTTVASGEPMAVSLKLNLVRTDMISSISPEPEINVARLSKDLADSKLSFNDSSAMVVSDDAATTAAVMVPVMAQARLAAENTSSLSNAKQVALGLLMYSNDYDDVMPYAESTGAIVKVTQPYLKNVKIWWTTDNRRFLFNHSLGGATSTEVERPAETILIYAEGPASDGKREVAFADGHARRLGPDEWSKYEATLHLKLKKTAKKPLPANFGQEYNRSQPPDTK